MGNTPSTQRQQDVVAQDADLDDGSRPAKRRRLEPTTKPSSKSKGSSIADHLFHSQEISTPQRGLRIQVLQITHKNASKAKAADFNAELAHPPRQVAETKARCKLTLSHAFNDAASVLHCQSQLCTLKTFETHTSPYENVRIWLPRPFHVPEESVFVHREDDERFHLADAYKVTIEIEAAGGDNWPPLEPETLLGSLAARHHGTESSRRWVLVGEVTHVLGKAARSMVPLRLKTPSTKAQATKFLFDVDARWINAYEASNDRASEKDSNTPRILFSNDPARTDYKSQAPSQMLHHNGISTVGLQDALLTPVKASNADAHVNGAGDGPHGGEDAEWDADGTPNRALRTRNSINYNLKDLSRKAQGKEARNRKRKELHEPHAPAPSNGGGVEYQIPTQTVHLESNRCIACGLSNASAGILAKHLEICHPQFIFSMNISAQGTQVQVVPRAESSDPSQPARSPLRTLQNGHQAAADQNEEAGRKKTRKRGAPTGPSTREPGQKTLRVPPTKQTLYDPISRLPLEPGSVFHPTKPDERWLVQWHREAIEDFVDIPPEEREFMTTWDAFMVPARLTSEVYLPYHWLEFVKAKADWIVESEARMVEFGKHLGYLITRDVLNDSTVKDAFKYITAAKDRLEQPDNQPAQEQRGKAMQPSASGCQVCGKPVLGPRLVFCANLKCRHPSYHADCVGQSVVMQKRDPNWRCSECRQITE